MIDTFVYVVTAFALSYGFMGAVYMLRLSWESISIRFSGLFALALAWALWPLVAWAEVGHAIRERAKRRAIQISSEQYLVAVKRAYELQERQIMGRGRRGPRW